MPTLEGRCVGGGSTFNSAICMRATDWALDWWREKHGLPFTVENLAPHYEIVEQFMRVSPTRKELFTERDKLFVKACENLGWNWEPILRNVAGCTGAAECFTGCRVGAKQHTGKRGIPEVIAGGGTVYSSVHVDKMIMSGNKSRGIIGRVVEQNGKRTYHVRITAKKTVLAAGAIMTPAIAQASGLRRRPIGDRLQFHPGTIVLGVYDHDVVPWTGPSQGLHVLDFLEMGIKLEAIWTPTSLIAFRVPGFAKSFKKQIAKMRKIAPFAGWVSGSDSYGRVQQIPGGRPRLTFNLAPQDVRRLQEATAKLAEMHFAAGALEVITGHDDALGYMNHPSQVRSLRQEKMTAQDFPTASNHVFGSMSMGNDSERHACDENGKIYGAENTFVCDTSLFPASAGVNPMLTAMMFGDKIGKHIAKIM